MVTNEFKKLVSTQIHFAPHCANTNLRSFVRPMLCRSTIIHQNSHQVVQISPMLCCTIIHQNSHQVVQNSHFVVPYNHTSEISPSCAEISLCCAAQPYIRILTHIRKLHHTLFTIWPPRGHWGYASEHNLYSILWGHRHQPHNTQ